jgi:hypothetical protein
MIHKMKFFGAVLFSAATLSAQHADYADCSRFGPEQEKYQYVGLNERLRKPNKTVETERLWQYIRQESGSDLAIVPGGSRTEVALDPDRMPTVDRHIYGELQARGITPARRSSDLEFLRRASLDLTGRLPSPEEVNAFIASEDANKRANLVDSLLRSPAWIDRWTMYYGDLFQNTANLDNINRFDRGRNAFHSWIRSSLETNKPYDQMARELIAARGNNTFLVGEVNWLVGGRVTGGPNQDIYDQMMVNVSTTFLGLNHMNCIGCHDGLGHLDTLSLWGKDAKRMQAWQMSSFFSRSAITQQLVDPARDNNLRWYGISDVGRADYTLNTTTGNRPARAPEPGRPNTVAPRYPFSDRAPAAGQGYRDFLAQEVTKDFQFARATVNYMWAAFFNKGLVEPLDQFDPARLDPDNPPPAPWSLQSQHLRLLNALAGEFVQNKFDLKWLMRTLATSEAYQMASVYDGQWSPEWEPFFARHYIRRLQAEEIHDGIAQTSGILPAYRYNTYDAADWFTPIPRTVNFAMQLPETRNTGNIAFLDAFFRGNREQEERKTDASGLQALNMMNDTFVLDRSLSRNNGGVQSLVYRASLRQNDEAIDQLFLTILSRPATTKERGLAREHIANSAGATRTQRLENLAWTLYNKLDFLYNY